MFDDITRYDYFCQFRAEIRGSKHHLIVGIDIGKDKHHAFFGTRMGKPYYGVCCFTTRDQCCNSKRREDSY